VSEFCVSSLSTWCALDEFDFARLFRLRPNTFGHPPTTVDSYLNKQRNIA